MARIIGVFSGKGGVGKTTLVSNLGVLLAQEGLDVAVVDANLTGANLGLHYGLISYPTSIHDVIKDRAAIKEAVYKHKSGVDIVPASLSFEEVLETEPKNLRDKLEALGKDIILIDAATGLDRETLKAMEMCDELIIVTHPELPTISDALRTKSVAKKFSKNVLGIVLNRVTRDDEIKKDNLSTFFDLPILGVIPEDHRVRKSIEKKNPIVLEYPNHRISYELKKIAARILGREPIKERESLIDKIKAFFRI
ncbi:MAG: cell division ATPase MinD [Candidatus Altiarchaeota archaeon]